MLALFFACTVPDSSSELLKIETGETGTTTETGSTLPEDLGDPYLAMVAPVPPGFLYEDCVMRVELFSGEDALGVMEIDPVVGGEWAGMDLEGGVQYYISTYHSQCTKLTAEETAESGAFSGIAGLLFVYHFNGTNSGVEALEQTVDYHGGTVFLTMETGAAIDTVEVVAADLGATVSADTAADSYIVNFPTDIPVGRVLAELAKVEGFLEASPDWIVQPSWW